MNFIMFHQQLIAIEIILDEGGIYETGNHFQNSYDSVCCSNCHDNPIIIS